MPSTVNARWTLPGRNSVTWPAIGRRRSRNPLAAPAGMPDRVLVLVLVAEDDVVGGAVVLDAVDEDADRLAGGVRRVGRQRRARWVGRVGRCRAAARRREVGPDLGLLGRAAVGDEPDEDGPVGDAGDRERAPVGLEDRRLPAALRRRAHVVVRADGDRDRRGVLAVVRETRLVGRRAADDARRSDADRLLCGPGSGGGPSPSTRGNPGRRVADRVPTPVVRDHVTVVPFGIPLMVRAFGFTPGRKTIGLVPPKEAGSTRFAVPCGTLTSTSPLLSEANIAV